MSNDTQTFHAMTSGDFVDALRLRARRITIWAAVLTLGLTGLLILVKGNVIVPLAILVAAASVFAVVQFPRTIFFCALAGACLFETFPLGFKDSITDAIPYFWNVNTIVQKYGGVNFHAMPVSPFEALLVLAGLSWLLRGIFLKQLVFSPGTLLVPIVFYVGCVIMGLMNGLATGGEFNMALFEARAQIYLLFAYLIGVNSARGSDKHIPILLWTTALAIGFKGILCTYRYFVTLHGATVAEMGVGSHEESFFFDSFVMLFLVLKLGGLEPKLRTVMLCLLPFVLIGNLANMRRAATASLAIAAIPLLVLAYAAFPKSRRFVIGVAVTVAVISAVYFPTFWNKDGMLAQPAHAVKSQFTPDPRDASSNLYRDQENDNLMFTMKTSPVIGYGYGKPIIIINQMIDLSDQDPFVHYMTHNQILWVWMRVGSIGFFCFWIMMMAFIIQGTQLARDLTQDDRTRAVAAFAVLMTIMLLVFGLLDLQISNIRDMLFCGLWIGTLAALRAKSAASEREMPQADLPIRAPRWSRVSTDGSGADAPQRAEPTAAKAWSRPMSPPLRLVSMDLPPRTADETPHREAPQDVPPFQTISNEPMPGPDQAPPAVSQGSRVMRNVGSTLGTQILSWALSFLVLYFVPRYLGAAGLGALQLAASVVGIGGLLVTLSTSTVLVRDIARDHASARRMIAAAVGLRILLWPVAIVLCVIAASLLHYPKQIVIVIAVAMSATILIWVNDALASALRGFEEFGKLNRILLIDKVITGVLTIAAVILHLPLWCIAIANAGGALIALFCYWRTLRPFFAASPHQKHDHAATPLPQRPVMNALVRASLPFLTTTIFGTIYTQTDPIFLKMFSSLTVIGWYAMAQRLGGTTMFIPTAVTGALLPTLSRTYKEDAVAFNRATSRLFDLMILCAVPAAAIMIFAPGPLLKLLHYPASFHPGIPVLQLWGAVLILWYLSQAAVAALVASDRQATFSKVTGIAAALSIPITAASVYLAQRFLANGALGAVFSDAAIEAYIVFVYLRALPPGAFSSSNVSVLGRAALAISPTALLLYFVPGHLVLYMIAPALMLYAGGCYLLRCLQPGDIQLLQSVVQRRQKAA